MDKIKKYNYTELLNYSKAGIFKNYSFKRTISTSTMKEELMSFYELPEDNIKSLEQAIKNEYPDIAHLVNFNELIPVMYYNFINKSGITEGICNDEFVNAGNSASPSSFDFFMEKFYLMELKSASNIENIKSHAGFRKRTRFWML